MRADERTRALLRTRLPKEWDSPLGRIEVASFRQTKHGDLWVMLARTGRARRDPNGYHFVRPPLQVYHGTMKHYDPAAALVASVNDAVAHYDVRGGPNNTTTTIFSSTADGRIYCHDTTYPNAREGTAAVENVDTTSASGGANWIGQNFTPDYFCSEVFIDFDGSSMPDTDNISDGTLSMYGQFDQSDTNFTAEARLHDWGGSLTADDFVPGSVLGSKTLLATFATSAHVNEAYNAFTSDAAFVGNISKTGITYIVLCSDRHRLGTTPTGLERVGWYLADEAGTTKDPKLVVNHVAGGGATVTRRTLLHAGQ
jgi:hypothetical protein